MPLETGTTISQLDDSWPLGTDLVLQGDDHLRLIKSILKLQFPGAGGTGFNKAITATEDEINFLSGVTSPIQTQIDAIVADDGLIAPSGTVMLFFQVAPPLGWTQVTNHNDSMLRVVNSAGGGFGGTDSPTAPNLSHVHTTANHTLTVNQIPAHTHNVTVANDYIYKGAGVWIESGDSFNLKKTTTYTTTEAGGGQSHNHGNTGSGNPTFRPRYINTILAAKD